MATYEEHVAPMLAARCALCHGPRKQKGGLRLDTPDFVVAAGAGLPGAALMPGSSGTSELVRRIRLPLDAEGRMPPIFKTQPSGPRTGARRVHAPALVGFRRAGR